MVPTTLSCQTAHMLESAVETLFLEHHDGGEQGNQQAWAQKVRNVDDFLKGTCPGDERGRAFRVTN